MTRKHTLEIRLYCIKCKDFTQSTGPIIINKLTTNRFNIKVLCSICNKLKSKFLNKEQIKLLPDEVLNSSDNSTFNDVIIRDGKAIPLLTLVPLVIAGISALTSAAGTTASVVLANKQANEDEKHHRELESLARGNGISNDISNDIIKNDTNLQTPNNGKGITIDPKLAAAIISLVPAAIEVLPSAVKTIKNLINGEGNKINEVIKIEKPIQDSVLSDEELDSRAITRLIGRGFNITI